MDWPRLNVGRIKSWITFIYYYKLNGVWVSVGNSIEPSIFLDGAAFIRLPRSGRGCNMSSKWIKLFCSLKCSALEHLGYWAPYSWLPVLVLAPRFLNQNNVAKVIYLPGCGLRLRLSPDWFNLVRCRYSHLNTTNERLIAYRGNGPSSQFKGFLQKLGA